MAKQAGTMFSLVLPPDLREAVEEYADANRVSKAQALVDFARRGLRATDADREAVTKSDLAGLVAIVAGMREEVRLLAAPEAEDVDPEPTYTSEDVDRARDEGRAEVRRQVLGAWGDLGVVGKMASRGIVEGLV